MDIQFTSLQTSFGVNQRHQEPLSTAVGESGGPLSQRGQDTVARPNSVEFMDQLLTKMKRQSEHPDKVADIKARIANGTFQIDTGKIADNLLWGERISAMSED